jgi:hypothetical protein
MSKKITKFDSLSELIAANECWEKAPNRNGSSSRGNGDFYGKDTPTYESAVLKARTGWQQGANRVSEMRSRLNDAVQSLASAKAARMHYDVDGDWVDIGRVVVGDPECCGNWIHQGDDRSSKIVKIYANICVSAAVNRETIFARGAACLAAVDLIETLGRRVELHACLGLSCAGRSAEIYTLVKEASQHVETDRLAYILCHDSMLRRIGFAQMEIQGFNPCSSYPSGVHPDEEDCIILPELLTGRTPSHEDTIRQMLDICKKVGIEFDEADIESACK